MASFDAKLEFLDKYFALCEEYEVYVGTARPGPVRLYESWGPSDFICEQHKKELREDIGA